MKNVSWILIVVSLSGCASLSKEVFENIHEGDSAAHLRDTLGNPDHFQPSVRMEGANAWYYNRRSETCGFTVKDETVKAIGCGRNLRYVNPAAAILGGMGQGLSNASANRINCTTTSYGNYASTSCR